LWQIVQDSELQKRDDIRGLIDYLHLRRQTQDSMARKGYRTLNSIKATGLRERWEMDVFRLIESNPAFGRVYARWLSRDNELQLPRGVK
jgi:hypothetical protein